MDFFQHQAHLHARVPRVECPDGSFISGIQTYLPNADITFDKFHRVKIVNEAIDAVRREEVSENEVLKKPVTSGLNQSKNAESLW
jgi:transposase